MGRRAGVVTTSSLPVKSSCSTVHLSLKVLWLPHITSYLGKYLCHLHSSCHRRLFPWKNSQPQLLPPHQYPNNLLGPKDNTLCQILWRACLWVELLQRLLWEDPPVPRGERPLPGSKHSSQATLRHLKQVNYALWSLPKGLKFLWVVPPSESPKSWD